MTLAQFVGDEEKNDGKNIKQKFHNLHVVRGIVKIGTIFLYELGKLAINGIKTRSLWSMEESKNPLWLAYVKNFPLQEEQLTSSFFAQSGGGSAYALYSCWSSKGFLKI